MKAFGQLGTQSLLDHEMTETSPVEMSYLQSQMHFDESMESIVDSDLEDGESQKLLTSPLYAQRASGKPDAMVVQEREVSAETSHSSEDHGASRKPAALFSPKRNEQRNRMWSSVFRNANLSNLSGTLLEGNKDHLLSQGKENFMSIHSISASVIYKNEWRRKAGHYRTYKTNLLNLFEQTRLQEELLRKEKALRDTKIRSKHEIGKMKRAQVQQVDEVSVQKLKENHETIQQFTFQLQQMQEQMNSMNDSGEFQDVESNKSGRIVSRFQST